MKYFEIWSSLIFTDMYYLFHHLRWVENLGRSLIQGKAQKKMYSYSSYAKDFIHFCARADECLFKNEEQNFWKKTVN